jgi:hypothetical protein
MGQHGNVDLFQALMGGRLIWSQKLGFSIMATLGWIGRWACWFVCHFDFNVKIFVSNYRRSVSKEPIPDQFIRNHYLLACLFYLLFIAAKSSISK